MEKQSRLANFPVSSYSIILGLSGFVIALHKMEGAFSLPVHLSTIFLFVVSALFVLLTVVYVSKMVKYPAKFSAEWNHPIKINFFPAFSISMLLLSIAFLNVDMVVSKVLWIGGTVIHLFLTLSVISFWIRHEKIEIKHMNPAWFIPVVGFIIIPVAGVAHAPRDISLAFFAIGLLFWPLLTAIFFNRTFFHHPLPEKLLPTMFILIAPPAVAFTALLRLTGEIGDLTKSFYYLALFFLVLMIFLGKSFIRIKFYLSWWAYSFPLSAVVISSLVLYVNTKQLVYGIIGGTVFGLLVLLLIIIMTKTVMAMKSKELCVEED